VITVRQGAASDLHPAGCGWRRGRSCLMEGPASVLWAIADQVVDDYAPVVEGLERDIEEVEQLVFSGSHAADARIYLAAREVTDFYRAVHPLLGPAAAITKAACCRSARGCAPTSATSTTTSSSSTRRSWPSATS
jgi:magnesium transporter